MAPPISSNMARTSFTPSPAIGGQKQSLYQSLLSLPPAKHARTIHNPTDPPLEAPSRSNTRRKGPDALDLKKQAQTASRADKGKAKAPLPSPAGEDDMKAAATLTSLLMHARPSVGAPSSPRSNAGSDTASAQSFVQFTQSSTRTAVGGATTAPTTAESSLASISIQGPQPSTTPPPRSGTSTATGTPRPAPTDNEAADLMLFLATSPSPVRIGLQRDREAKDLAAFRALGGSSGLRAKGRVLFPSASEPSLGNDAKTNSAGGSSGKRAHHRLEMAAMLPTIEPGRSSSHASGAFAAATETSVTPLTPSEPSNVGMPSTLLPALASPSRPPSASPSRLGAPGTPGNLPFNLNEFINVSPSPAGRTRRLYDDDSTSNGANGLGAGISL